MKHPIQHLLLTIFLASCAPATVPLTPTATPAPTATSVPTAIVTPTPKFAPGTNKTSSVDEMTQRFIPAGVFLMGTLADGDWVGKDEFPQHEVYLDSFWMDGSEVTNSQYQ